MLNDYIIISHFTYLQSLEDRLTSTTSSALLSNNMDSDSESDVSIDITLQDSSDSELEALGSHSEMAS